MAFTPEEYSKRDLNQVPDDPPRRPPTVRELLDHPERRAELYLEGGSHQSSVDAVEAAEDAYYDALGAEIDRHPICSPRLILQRQGRNNP